MFLAGLVCLSYTSNGEVLQGGDTPTDPRSHQTDHWESVVKSEKQVIQQHPEEPGRPLSVPQQPRATPGSPAPLPPLLDPNPAL